MSYNFDPYHILGLSKSANIEQIRHSYQDLVRRLRTSQTQGAESQLELVEEAYRLLSDSIQRRRYNEHLASLDSEAEKIKQFSLRVTPSKRTVKPLEEEQVIYLLAEMFAPSGIAQKMQEREVQLNLTLVIDHSKSMEDEGRMQRVIGAAQTIITELTHKDVISVVAFNDRASVIIPATTVHDIMALRARVGMIKPRGGTEIFQGLSAGVQENRKFLEPKMVNHIILLTDGRTYGDEKQCIELARMAAKEGISVSAMGLGSDWNDKFLDQLASITGGTSSFIKSVNMVSTFMEEQLRSLSNAFAERLQLSMVTSQDINIEMAFKISPHPQPLSSDSGQIPLASLQANRPVSVLLQLQLPANMPLGNMPLVHFVTSGDVMLNQAQTYYTSKSISIDVREGSQEEPPPSSIVDALSKLTLYRLQEKAQDAMDSGDVDEATKHLKHLATRLIDMGEVELGRQAMAEAQHVLQTRAFSNEENKKTIKYQTRALIEPGGMKKAITTLFNDD